MSLTHIETIELGSSQASITFSSIPQDYDDLIIKFSARQDGTSSVARLEFNGSSSNLSSVIIQGNGSSAISTTLSFIESIVADSQDTANTFGSGSAYISNYTASQAKSVSIESVAENNATAALMRIEAGLWNDTSAITSATITAAGNNFVSGSVFSLYGVTAGGDGTVTTS